MYEETVSYVHNHWIKEVVKFPRFQIAVRKYWKLYRDSVFPGMEQFAIDYGNQILEAGKADYKRWKDGSSLAIDVYLRRYMRYLDNKRRFLASRWDTDWEFPKGDVNLDGLTDISDINLLINVMLGRQDASLLYGDPDVTGDGRVDVGDVNAVINAMLGRD